MRLTGRKSPITSTGRKTRNYLLTPRYLTCKTVLMNNTVMVACASHLCVVLIACVSHTCACQCVDVKHRHGDVHVTRTCQCVDVKHRHDCVPHEYSPSTGRHSVLTMREV